MSRMLPNNEIAEKFLKFEAKGSFQRGSFMG